MDPEQRQRKKGGKGASGIDRHNQNERGITKMEGPPGCLDCGQAQWFEKEPGKIVLTSTADMKWMAGMVGAIAEPEKKSLGF
ncbi:hypothetical protein ACOMHN_007442 [Nucella lapillus]